MLEIRNSIYMPYNHIYKKRYSQRKEFIISLVMIFMLSFYQILIPLGMTYVLAEESGPAPSDASKEETKKEDQKDESKKEASSSEKPADKPASVSQNNAPKEETLKTTPSLSEEKNDSASSEPSNTSAPANNSPSTDETDPTNPPTTETTPSTETPVATGDNTTANVTDPNSTSPSIDPTNPSPIPNPTDPANSGNPTLNPTNSATLDSTVSPADTASGEKPSDSSSDNNNSNSSSDDTANPDSATAKADPNPTPQITATECASTTASEQDDSSSATDNSVITVVNQNCALIENAITSASNTGENAVNQEPLPENIPALATDLPGSSALIGTGDAETNSTLINDANTNVYGTNGEIIMANIEGTYSGDISLLAAFQRIINNSAPNSDSNEILIDITNNNDVIANNNVDLTANSGNNTIVNGTTPISSTTLSDTPEKISTITTGDATAISDIINFFNTNIVGDNWMLAMINVFGQWSGNLIVPQKGQLKTAAAPSYGNVEVTNNNQANINNTVSTIANTGENTSTATESTIATGSAISSNGIATIANTNIIKDNWFLLFVNNMGSWVGQVMNWNKETDQYNTVYSYDFGSKDPTNPASLKNRTLRVNNTNNAEINNNVALISNSGQNDITADGGTAEIQTGDALAMSRIFNMVNTNIVGSNWLFGIVNIFGKWTGNLGFGSATVPPQQIIQREVKIKKIIYEENSGAIGGDGIMRSRAPYALSIARKSDVESTVGVEEVMTHALIVANVGTNSMPNVKVEDRLLREANEESFYSWDLGSMKSGDILVVRYEVKLNNDAPSGDYLLSGLAIGQDGNGNEIKSEKADLTFKFLGSASAFVEGVEASEIIPTAEAAGLNSNTAAPSLPVWIFTAALVAYLLAMNWSLYPIREQKKYNYALTFSSRDSWEELSWARLLFLPLLVTISALGLWSFYSANTNFWYPASIFVIIFISYANLLMQKIKIRRLV